MRATVMTCRFNRSAWIRELLRLHGLDCQGHEILRSLARMELPAETVTYELIESVRRKMKKEGK